MQPHAHHLRIIVALVSLSVGLVAVPVIVTGTAAASTTASSNAAWAYGGHWGMHRSGPATIDAMAGVFSATEYFGWETILSQTNTSATTFLVTANWTEAGYLWGTFCSPNCASPTVVANLTDRAIEMVTAATDFTTAAAVTESQGNVTALGISQATAELTATISENTSIHGSAVGGAGHSATRKLSVHDLENAGITFAPALGLVPSTTPVGSSWTSQSNYDGFAVWNASFNYSAVNLLGVATASSGQVNGSVPATGVVSLSGSGTGAAQLSGGVSASSSSLSLTGPFTLVDGSVLVPGATELFHPGGSGAQRPWMEDRLGNESVSLLTLDVRSTGVPHVGIVASAMTFASASSVPPPSSSSGSSGATNGAQDVESAVVQGQPQTVSAAETGDSCLELGIDCGSPSSGTNSALLAGLVAVGVVVALGAIVGALVVERRRRVPPPPHSPTFRYSPGVARAPDSPSGVLAPPGSVPKEPATPDPLDNLW